MASIDPKILADLRALEDGGSPGFLAELIDIFLKEQPQHLARLRQGLTQKDAVILERAAHTLKGSSGNLGARELSKLCARMQEIARAKDWTASEDLVGRIEREAAIVEAELLVEKRRPKTS